MQMNNKMMNVQSNVNNLPQLMIFEPIPQPNILPQTNIPMFVDPMNMHAQMLPTQMPFFQIPNQLVFPQNVFPAPNLFPIIPTIFPQNVLPVPTQPLPQFIPMTPTPFNPVQNTPTIPTLTLPPSNMLPQSNILPNNVSPSDKSCSFESDSPKCNNWRSKQDKILETRAVLQQKYTELELLVGPDHMLRGPDTVRCHIKSFTALCLIGDVLDEIMNHHLIEIKHIAIPLSRKNESQNKGLIIYLQAMHDDQIPIVQSIFRMYPQVTKKCEMAMPKNAIIAYKAKKKAEKEAKKKAEEKAQEKAQEPEKIYFDHCEAYICTNDLLIKDSSLFGA